MLVSQKNKKILYKLAVIIGVFVFQILASKLGGIIANSFDHSILDKDNTFMWVTVHHLVQMIIALLLITIIHKIIDVNFRL